MRSLCALVLLLSATIHVAPAQAQRRRGPSPDEIRRLLHSTDRDEVQSGIEAIGLSGSARFVVVLSDRIRRGLPAELLDTALDTLMVLGRPEAGPVLFVLSAHRRPDVRRKAIEAIVACRPRGAESAVAGAMSDADPRVRAVAAQGLGQLGARDRIDVLFLALDRGVLEAATSIGQLAGADHVARVLEYLGRLPFDAVSPALFELLSRDDVPQASKLDVIGRLAELATGEVRSFLSDFVAVLPEEARHQRLRDAAQAAIDRIAG